MLTTYLNTLKTRGNFTYEAISNLSGVPEATVRNILTGKTEDPRFESVSSIVIAMGGSLDAIYSAVNEENIEANAVIAIKDAYEERIAIIRENYENRLAEKEKYYERLLQEAEKHIETIKVDKRWFRIASVVSVIAMFGLFIFIEAMTPGHGWFQY